MLPRATTGTSSEYQRCRRTSSSQATSTTPAAVMKLREARNVTASTHCCRAGPSRWRAQRKAAASKVAASWSNTSRLRARNTTTPAVPRASVMANSVRKRVKPASSRRR